MIILSGKVPLISLYFLRAYMTAGFMVLFSSWLAPSCRLAELMNLVKEALTEATRAPAEVALFRVSWYVSYLEKTTNVI